MNTEWMAVESDNQNRGPYVVYKLSNGHRIYDEGDFNFLAEAQERADDLNEEHGYEPTSDD